MPGDWRITGRLTPAWETSARTNRIRVPGVLDAEEEPIKNPENQLPDEIPENNIIITFFCFTYK